MSDGDHRSRHRVPQTGERHRPRDPRSGTQTPAIGEKQRHAQRDRGGDTGQCERVPHEREKFRFGQRRTARPGPARQLQDRDPESTQHGQHAGRAGRQCARPPQCRRRDGSQDMRGMVIARTAARQAFGDEQDQDEHQQQRRETRRRDSLAQPEPGAKDPGREGVHTEILHRAVVREGLHQRERQTRDDRGTRHRQRHVQKGPTAIEAEAARHIEHIARLLAKGRARQQIDIGIEHQRQHQDGARQRTHLRKAVIADTPTRPGAQCGLHRPRHVEHARVGVRDDVGGHREWRDQQPLECAPPGKAIGAHQPRRHDAHRSGDDGHTQHEQQRVGDVGGQDRRGQVIPALARGEEQRGQDGDDRQGDQAAQCQHRQRPARHGRMKTR